ncbi:lamin tail domain-containing protein [Eubacteriales bacterium OttesenSCG-928-A19]|nr:lamin tail domain-containing protein [Eubacteriales bacterium OttesenSCG-928-A19]
MARQQNPPPRKNTPKRQSGAQPQKKAPSPGTPVRNTLMLVIFAAVLIAMVVLLPKEPQKPMATVLTPDGSTLSATEAEDVPIRISEVMASNRNAYPDEKGNYPDWLEITNTGDEPVNIGDIGLSDRDDRVLFLFPNMTLDAGEYLIVFCDDTNANDPEKPLHARFKISSLGETIYLFNQAGVIMDSVVVPGLGADMSYALMQSGWVTTEQYTPGYPNTDAGYEAFRSQAVGSADGLVINELVASNVTTLQDEDGDYPDWIELYNGGTTPVDLSYYALSDDETDLVKWRFPQGAVIQPNSYYLVFASGKDRTGEAGRHPHTNFKLAAEGETVILSDILCQQIDRVSYDNLGKDVSWGRVEGMEESWAVFQQPTPGMPNNQTSAVEMDARMRASNTSGVFISEVVITSSGVDTPYGNTSYDWIEIVNLGSAEVDLTGWGLSDKISRPRKWQFPAKTIQPGEYMIVFPSGLTESPTGSDAIHVPFRLSALGETITLSDPQGKILDKLVVPTLETNNSYGRNFDQGGLFYYEIPTAGERNLTQGFSGYAQKPTISMAGGIFTKPVSVTITAPSTARVRYTLDGSIPTLDNGHDYIGQVIELTEPTPLRARGFTDGLKPSEIATETYLVNIYHTLPIIALTVDPYDLYNPDDGMLAEDEELKATYTKVPFEDLTYWKKTPHPGNFEYFLPEGEQMLNQGVEIQLNGQFSLDQAQKSFRVTARARYGTGTMAYPFFEDRPFLEYQAVVLRSGGQDGKYTRIIDALQSKIIDWTDSTVIHMASTPVIVFINGEYWGHYNLRERINKHSIAAYEGIEDPENIDFIKGDNHVINGTFSNYRSLRDYCKNHDLNDPEALQTVLDWIDVDNYFDFMIFQIYFGNTDAGNIKYYRERKTGAKWRWVVFDLDWGYFNSQRDGCYVWLKPEGAGQQRFNNIVIRRLLEVPEMRDKFLRRYGQLFQETLSDTDRIRALADEMIGVIEPELTLHFNRWAGLNHPLVSEEPTTAEGLEAYWRSHVSRMQNVFKKRPHYAWQHVKDWFELSDEEMIGYFGPQPEIPADAI